MLHLLVVATAAAGALLPWLLPSPQAFDPWVFGVLAVLAAGSGLRCLKPAGRGTWFVPTDAFVLAAIATVGGRAACAIALAGVLATTLGMAGKLAARRAVFNAGAVVVATASGAAAFSEIGVPAGAFVAAAASLFLVNTGLVATAVALDRARPWLATWRAAFLPALPRFALEAMLGGALASLAAWVR